MAKSSLTEWVILTFRYGFPEVMAHGEGLKRGIARLHELKSGNKLQDTMYGYKLYIRDSNVERIEQA